MNVVVSKTSLRLHYFATEFIFMRLHRNLIEAVVKALQAICNEGEYADNMIEKVLKLDKRWVPKIEGLLLETDHEIIRYKRLYFEIMGIRSVRNKDHADRVIAVWCVVRLELPPWICSKERRIVCIKGKFDQLSKN